MQAELDGSFRAARSICRKHAKSFYFASYFLPREKRDAAYAVYAFCRLLDDAVDEREGSGADVNRDDASSEFGRLLTRCYTGSAGDLAEPAPAFFPAFALVVRKYSIPQQYFLDLVAGCRMDLTKKRYATWAELEVYCYHVAGVVGLIMSCIFQLRNERARENAVQTGIAMQLTNILRDVGEDYRRGRIYLPREDLDRFGCSEADIAAGRVSEAFRSLMQFEIARAGTLFQQGAEGLCHLPNDGSRLTACAMSVIYAGILEAIERQHYDVFSRRAHLTTFQKFAKLPGALRLSNREQGDPIPVNVYGRSPTPASGCDRTTSHTADWTARTSA